MKKTFKYKKRNTDKIGKGSFNRIRSIIFRGGFFVFIVLNCSLSYANTASGAFNDASTALNGGYSPQQVISMGSTSQSSPQDISLMLEVSINKTLKKGFFSFIQKGKKIYVTQSTLQSLGFKLPSTSNLVSLSDIPTLKYKYDEQTQIINIDVALSVLNLGITQLNTQKSSENIPNVTSRAPFGMMLNYDVYGSSTNNKNTLSNFSEFRVFKDHWIFSTTQVYNSSVQQQNHLKRLDTFFKKAILSNDTQLTIGDTLSSSTSDSRPTRMLGIQWSKDFSLSPYTITQPLAQFAGSATLPSNVELFINGIKQYESKVPAGNFQLKALPSLTGQGQASLVVTNLLGQQQVTSIPFYSTPSLLAKGLSTWSMEMGVPRQNYGIKSFDYAGPLFTSQTLRYGLNNQMTLEGGMLLSSPVQMLNVGTENQLGTYGGVLSLGLSLSSSKPSPYINQSNQKSKGVQWNVGYTLQKKDWYFALNYTQANAGFQDLPSYLGSLNAIQTGQVTLSRNFHRWGNFGVSYFKIKYPGQSASQYATLNWSNSTWRDGSINASLTQNLANSSDLAIYLGVTFNLSRNYSTGISLQKTNQGLISTAIIDHPISQEQGWGWRGFASNGISNNYQELDVMNRSKYFDSNFGVQNMGGQINSYGEIRGSMVWVENHPFFGRETQSSFALVSTAPYSKVPVYIENRLYGVTDKRGYLMISDLQPWQNNKIKIDTLDLPADVQIGQVVKQAVPPQYAGSLVRFSIEPIQTALLQVIDEKGKNLPVGTSLTYKSTSQVNGKIHQSMVGYDGQAYLDGFKTYPLQVQYQKENQVCSGVLMEKQTNSLPEKLKLVCKK